MIKPARLGESPDERRAKLNKMINILNELDTKIGELDRVVSELIRDVQVLKESPF